MTGGRGPDAVIDAVGMEAHGRQSPRASLLTAAAQRAAGLLPGPVARTLTDEAGLDRLDALHAAIKAVRRGGTVCRPATLARPQARYGWVEPDRAPFPWPGAAAGAP
jgi:threonine dehydrogenase-like Zn-dependent dehydrogenase